MDQRSNVRTKTVNLLGEILNLHDLRLCNDFLEMSPKAQATTKLFRKIGLHQISIISG